MRYLLLLGIVIIIIMQAISIKSLSHNITKLSVRDTVFVVRPISAKLYDIQINNDSLFIYDDLGLVDIYPIKDTAQ